MKAKIEDLQKQVIQPGIYFNMPKEIYHNDKSLSNSGMGNLLKNPQKYYDKAPINPNRVAFDTATFKRGRIFHTLLLEPHKFHSEWKIKSGVQTSKVEGFVGEGEYNDFIAAISNFRQDMALNGLFRLSYPEVSIFYIDEETGVPCRACIDSLGLTLTVDAKSTSDLSDAKLRYSITDYGYPRQAAMYLKALNQIKQLIKENKAIVVGCPNSDWLEKFLDSIHTKFVFLFMELESPYLYRAEELCETTLDEGMAEYRAACHKFKECYEEFGSDKWLSGYEGKVGLIQRDDLHFRKDF